MIPVQYRPETADISYDFFQYIFSKFSFSACSLFRVFFAPQTNNLPINVLLFVVRCARPTSTHPHSSLKMMDTLGKLVEGGSIFSSPLVLAFWGACLLLGSCFLPALIWHGRTGRSNGTDCRSDEPFEGNEGELIKRVDCFPFLRVQHPVFTCPRAAWLVLKLCRRCCGGDRACDRGWFVVGWLVVCTYYLSSCCACFMMVLLYLHVPVGTFICNLVPTLHLTCTSLLLIPGIILALQQ